MTTTHVDALAAVLPAIVRETASEQAARTFDRTAHVVAHNNGTFTVGGLYRSGGPVVIAKVEPYPDGRLYVEIRHKDGSVYVDLPDAE